MRVILQRVKKASCKIDNQITGAIKHGFVILVGFTNGDDESKVAKAVKKIINLRVFADEEQKMNLNILQVGGSILSISQFTLYANTNEGNRPSFINSLNPTDAEVLYHTFNQALLNNSVPVKTGKFGEHMEIELINDGPVTITLEF